MEKVGTMNERIQGGKMLKSTGWLNVFIILFRSVSM